MYHTFPHLPKFNPALLPPVFQDVYYYGPHHDFQKAPVFHMSGSERVTIQYLSCIKLEGKWLGNSEEDPRPHELLMCPAYEGMSGLTIRARDDGASFNIPNVYHYTNNGVSNQLFRESEGKKRIRLGQDDNFPIVLSLVQTYTKRENDVDLSSKRSFIAAIGPKTVEEIRITPYDSQDTKYHEMRVSGKPWEEILSRAYLMLSSGCATCYSPDLGNLPHMVRTTIYGEPLGEYTLVSGKEKVTQAEGLGLGYILALYSEIVEWI